MLAWIIFFELLFFFWIEGRSYKFENKFFIMRYVICILWVMFIEESKRLDLKVFLFFIDTVSIITLCCRVWFEMGMRMIVLSEIKKNIDIFLANNKTVVCWCPLSGRLLLVWEFPGDWLRCGLWTRNRGS